MNTFQEIDLKLADLAQKLNARLTKDRPDYPEVLRTFEERRIDWKDDQINKAIIIQPNFEHDGVNSSIWNFINIAWFDDAVSITRPQWIRILVDKGKFETIEKNIDKLLTESEENLARVKMVNLK
jgi:hypothetical protein